MKIYVLFCEKCREYLQSYYGIEQVNAILAKNRDEAWKKMERMAAHHDASVHPDDGEWANVDLIEVRPTKKLKRCQCSYKRCCDACWRREAKKYPCPTPGCKDPKGHQSPCGRLNKR